MIRRLLALAIAVYGLTLAGSAFFAWRYQTPDLPQAAAVIVLSAGSTPAGEMDAQTTARTERGIEIWRALATEGQPPPLLIMSGGGDIEKGHPIKGELMADAARNAGVPEEFLRAEGQSGSTLHNALYSKDILGEQSSAPLVFVTHRYHGLRSWVSLQWAGLNDITFVPAEDDDTAPVLNGLWMEGIKWPVNIIRGGGYSALTATGVDAETLLPYLE